MTIKIEHYFGALFVLQILSSLFAKIQALFLFAKNFGKLFVSNEGNRKLPIMGVLEDWDFFKKEIFFVYASYASCMCIVRKTKKLLLWGLKRTASLYGENFFSVWGNM